ncbi:MAG: sodium-dependent transporter [Euryarchaeota archaeon]|nr:sodium-dependent transporter [Euryarchaeota archaeon]
MVKTQAAMGTPEGERGAWSSRTGFILAAVGSAVGLGNIWRFPFSAAEGGGAAFIFIYLVLLLLIGLPIMFAELAIGRKARLNPIGSFRKLTEGNRLWVGAGVLFVGVSLFIISWYSVIAGWVMRYAFGSVVGSYFDDPAGYFTDVQTGMDALGYHIVVMVLTASALAIGVSKGIERVATIMMPILFTLAVFIAVYVGFLSGSGEGYSFMFAPDFSEVDGSTVRSAAGQALFSLSLGQGAILTYASYLDKKESLTTNGTIISIADTGVAILGGLMVLPALAAFGLLTGENAQGGAGALFIGLANAFSNMGIAGYFVGTAFFVSLFFAAFTSAISLLEVSVSFVVDQWNVPRKKAALLMGLIAYSGGIIAAVDGEIMGFMSGSWTDAILILGALLISIFVGYVMKDAIDELDRGGIRGVGRITIAMTRTVVPIILIVLLVLAIKVEIVDQYFASIDLFGW